MYQTKTQTIRIDLNSTKDLARYDAVLNDPDCAIVREVREKISTKTFNDEGKIAGLQEELIAIVTFRKKMLLEE